jgi:leucyl aminopeptidase
MSFEFSKIKKYVSKAKKLANMPPNLATPGIMADKLIEDFSTVPGDYLHLTVKKAATLPLIKAVDNEDGRLLILFHNCDLYGVEERPIVLIGKGVCFDSGGYNLKHSNMHEMKFDKAGAMSVYSVIKACKNQDFPRPVIAILPLVNNKIGSSQTFPGSVITTTLDRTVEIRDTDAEGRLILADAIETAQRMFNPEIIVTVATLTGSCANALGEHYTGMFSNLIDCPDVTRNPLSTMVFASEKAKDPIWPLPVNKEHVKNLKKSKVADIMNYNKKECGGSSAAAFLAYFIEDTPWIHLDIAGTAWKDDEATGRPTALLLTWLESMVKEGN